MIASPCKNCPKQNEPKENGIKDCELLQAVQDIQYASKEAIGISGIDYAAGSRKGATNQPHNDAKRFKFQL